VLAEWEMWRPGMYTIKEPLYGIAFALVVVATLQRERAGTPTADTAIGRRLAEVGVYSYSLYLVHRPIQFFFEPAVRRVVAAGFLGLEPVTASLLLMAATTPVVLLAARLFHRYCEAPCVAIAQRVGTATRSPRAVDRPVAGLTGFDRTDARLEPPSAAPTK
jgi:peptidoglycan/LPS O-acetylase OafA/YrhL